MFANYKGRLYRFSESEDGYFLLTEEKSKTDSLFKKGNRYFLCPIKLKNEELTDVFEVTMFVTYDIQIEQVDSRWQLYGDRDEVMKNQVKLYFGLGGSLPGFTQIDKCECIKYVPIKDLLKIEIVKKYKKRNGHICDEVVCEELQQKQFIMEHDRFYGKV